MRIESVECISVVMPIHGKYAMAGGTHDAVRSVIVKVATSDGVVGVGEAHQGVGGYSYESVETIMAALQAFFAPALIGEDVRDVDCIMVKLNRLRKGHPWAKCALDVALHDALGKQLGQPISRLLGGAHRKVVPLVGNVGMAPPQEAAEKAVALVEEGYTTIKVKVGGPDLKEEIARVRAVREAVGPDIALRVDANAAYSTTDALRLVDGIGPLGLQLLEQPVSERNLLGLERVRQVTSTPIMVDEGMFSPEDAFQIFSNRLADMVKIKIVKSGGFRGAMKIIAIAEAAGASVVVGHGICTSIQALAEVHLAASSPIVLEAGEMVGPSRLVEDLVERPMAVHRGSVEVPAGPGLGVELREEALSRFAQSRFLIGRG